MPFKHLLAFSTLGEYLAHFSSNNNVLSVHSLGKGTPTTPVYVTTKGVLSLDFHPQQTKLACASTNVENGAGLLIYSFLNDSKTLNGAPIQLNLNDDLIYPHLIKYSRNGQWLAVYGRCKLLKNVPTKPGQNSEWKNVLVVLNTENYNIVHHLDINLAFEAFEWNLRGDCLLGAGQNGCLNIYQLNNDQFSLRESISLSTSPLSCLKYSESEDIIIIGTRDGNVLLLDPKTLTCVKTILSEINGPVSKVSISKWKDLKVASVTYAQGVNLPAYMVLLDNDKFEILPEELSKLLLKKPNKHLERALREHFEEKGNLTVGSIIGEFRSKLIDAALPNQNPLNIIGDGVYFQPHQEDHLGMISFINTEGKVAIRNVNDILTDYWKEKFQSQVNEWSKSEKNDQTHDNQRKPQQQQPQQQRNRNPNQQRNQQRNQTQSQAQTQGHNPKERGTTRQTPSDIQQQRYQQKSGSNYQLGDKRDRDRDVEGDRDRNRNKNRDYDYDRNKRQHRR